MTFPHPWKLFVNRKIGYIRHHKQGGLTNVADEFAAVAVAQPSSLPTTEAILSSPSHSTAITFADRADRGVELLSRWAGIVVFVGAVAAIAWAIF